MMLILLILVSGWNHAVIVFDIFCHDLITEAWKINVMLYPFDVDAISEILTMYASLVFSENGNNEA